jgi:hypothetical protein
MFSSVYFKLCTINVSKWNVGNDPKLKVFNKI